MTLSDAEVLPQLLVATAVPPFPVDAATAPTSAATAVVATSAAATAGTVVTPMHDAVAATCAAAASAAGFVSPKHAAVRLCGGSGVLWPGRSLSFRWQYNPLVY